MKGIYPIMATHLDDLARATREQHDATPLGKKHWNDLDAEKKHRWCAAAGHAAVTGADFVLALLRQGETDPERLRERVLRAYGCGGYDKFTGGTGPHPDLARERGKAITTTGNRG